MKSKADRISMRVTNPSASSVRTWGTDAYIELRQYCTCPGCHVVWTHKETGNVDADWQWAKPHYQSAYLCPECGLITEALVKPTWKQTWHDEYRQLVETEPSANPCGDNHHEEDR